MSHRVRRGDEADAVVIAELNRFVQALHFEHRPDRFNPPKADDFQTLVEHWLQSGEWQIWLAEEGDDAFRLGM